MVIRNTGPGPVGMCLVQQLDVTSGTQAKQRSFLLFLRVELSLEVCHHWCFGEEKRDVHTEIC